MDVTLVLTHDCNLGCGYCYMGAKFAKRMAPETASKALDLALADRPSKLQVSFFGGEPLLAWNQLVRSARDARARAETIGADLTMCVTTNGTLLTDDRARLLDELGVYVALSIDGVRDAHDAGRPKMGGGSSFDEVARGLSVLLRRGTPFETISVVTPTNVKHLGETARWLLELGVPRIGLNPCYEAYFDDDALRAYEDGLTEAAELMVSCFEHDRIVSFPVFDNKIMAALKGGLDAGDRCSLGDGSIAVAPSGNIYPCERVVGEDEDHRLVLGTVFDGIHVQGDACARGPVNAECGDCAESFRCGSFCACANLAETGRTDVAGGTQCWHERTTADLADRIATTLWDARNPLFLAWFYGRMAEGIEPRERPERGEVRAIPRRAVEGRVHLSVLP